MYLHSWVSWVSFSSPCQQLLPWWYALAVQLLCEQTGSTFACLSFPQVGVLQFILDLMLDLLQVVLHLGDQLLIVFIDAVSKERPTSFSVRHHLFICSLLGFVPGKIVLAGLAGRGTLCWCGKLLGQLVFPLGLWVWPGWASADVCWCVYAPWHVVCFVLFLPHCECLVGRAWVVGQGWGVVGCGSGVRYGGSGSGVRCGGLPCGKGISSSRAGDSI